MPTIETTQVQPLLQAQAEVHGALLVGGGFTAGAHAEALRRLGIPVVGLIASTPERTEAAARRYGLRAYPDSWTAMHDAAVTVVHDCAPSDVHTEVNLEALKAGKHIFSEKPLGVTAAETRRQLDFALGSRRRHGVHFTYRHYPMVRELRERVRRGDLGELRFMRGHYLQDWLLSPQEYNWRLEAGAEETRALGDIGTHLLDLARFVSGLEAVQVFARLAQMFGARYRPGSEQPFRVQSEDQATLLVEYGGQVSATFEVAQVYAGQRNNLTLELYGTHGSARWSQERPEELRLSRQGRPDEVLYKSALLTPAAAALMHYPAGHPEGYPDALTNAIREFYTSLNSSSHKDHGDVPTFADGHAAALTVAAASKSHAENRWVSLAEAEPNVPARSAAGVNV